MFGGRDCLSLGLNIYICKCNIYYCFINGGYI